MKYHAYQTKCIDGNNVPQYYAYCGVKGTNGRKFFYSPDMFLTHYAKDHECKKCKKTVGIMFPGGRD